MPTVFINSVDDPIVPPPLLEIVRDAALKNPNMIFIEQVQMVIMCWKCQSIPCNKKSPKCQQYQQCWSDKTNSYFQTFETTLIQFLHFTSWGTLVAFMMKINWCLLTRHNIYVCFLRRPILQKFGGHLGFYEGGFFYSNPLTWQDRMVTPSPLYHH